MADTAAAKLEPFLLLARSQKGAAAAKIASDATSAPGVYVFSELLQLQSIQDLESDANLGKAYLLLQLFAYGTLQSYRAQVDSYPPLSPIQLTKLKHLSLIDLAASKRSIPYDLLLSSLELASERELEDMIIDVIYAGLLKGKMHHHEKVFHVDWSAGRDVAPNRLPALVASLDAWCANAASILHALDGRIASVRAESHSHAAALQAFKEFRDREFAVTVADRGGRSKGAGLGGDKKAFGSAPAYSSGGGSLGGVEQAYARNFAGLAAGLDASSSVGGAGGDAGRFLGMGQTLGLAETPKLGGTGTGRPPMHDGGGSAESSSVPDSAASGSSGTGMSGDTGPTRRSNKRPRD